MKLSPIKLLRPSIWLVCMFCIACCPLVTGVYAGPVQWQVSAGGNGHWYEAVLVSDGLTWSRASDSAVSSGGYLVTLTSAQENDFVFELVRYNADFWYGGWGDGFGPWIGGLQGSGSSEPAGGWGWITGEPMSYTNWGPGEPNDGIGNEDRLCLFGKNQLIGSYWDDTPGEVMVGTSFSKGYIVEFNAVPVPEPGSTLLLLGIGLVPIAFSCRWWKK
jgi:hypothetical protein